MFMTFILPLLAVISSLNIYYWHSPILGLVSGLFFVGLSSILWGKKIFKEKTLGEQIYLGLVFFLALVIVFLTIIYYIYEINNLLIIVFLWLLSLVEFFIDYKHKIIYNLTLKIYNFKITTYHLSLSNCFLVSIYLILLFITYYFLKAGITYEAVRTPWIFVPKIFFLSYFLSTLFLGYLNFKLKITASLILNSLHLFFSFSLVNIIFPLGFGYDPFIHQATEKYILDFGSILPKNFYYLGQYSLVVFLTKILQWPVNLVDKNLLPLLASILLPSAIYQMVKNWQLKTIPLFLFLLIPFSVFTFTTPQNLADLLLIVLIFISFNLSFYQLPITSYQLPITNYQLPVISYQLSVILSLAILFIHPIAGVAAFIFLILLILRKIKLKKYFYYFLLGLLSFSYIFVFFIFGKISSFNEIVLINNFNLINFYKNIFRFVPDLYLNTNVVHLFKTIIYFIWQPIVLFVVILGLAVWGYFKIKKGYGLSASPCLTDRQAAGRRITDYGLLFIILLVNSWLLFSIIDFPFLINYERGDFSWRIFNLAVYFLIPLALWALGYLIEKINLRTKKYLLIIFLAAALTCSLYFSYPRQDVYMLNRGFNTSLTDFQTVNYLEDKTQEPYVVLSNQQLGAAALSTLGFRYFDNKYFFYSIPTGGELYQIYAKIAYEQDLRPEVIQQVRDFVDVPIVYLCLPNYWFNLKKIKPQLQTMADETIQLDNGKMWIFKFILY